MTPTPPFLHLPTARCTGLGRWLALATLLLAGLLPLRSLAQAPANDLCSSATVLVAASTCAPINGTLYNATADPAFDTNNDVWYQFTATSTEAFVEFSGAAYGNFFIKVFESPSCPTNAAVNIAFGPAFQKAFIDGLIPTHHYYVRLYSDPANVFTAVDGAFTICLTQPYLPTPANDLCTAPQLLIKATPCATVVGTVGGATANPTLDDDDDVWYSFVANGTQHTITVTPTGVVNLFTEVYGVNCPINTTTPIYHNASSSTSVVTGLTPGTTYAVRVANFDTFSGFVNAADGGFTICVNNAVPAPANDECAGAIGLGTVTSTCTATNGTLYGATQSGVSGGPGTADDDVWYSFVAPAGGKAGIYLTSTGGLDLVVDLRTAPCATSTSLRTGNQGGATVGAQDTITARNLTPLQTYYVRVYSYGTTAATAANGTFSLCVTTPGTCAPPTALTATNLTNTTAQLNWTAGASAYNYTVEYGPTGFTPGTGTVVTTALTSLTITGLTQSTAYQFYVTQTCGSSVNSVRVGPQAFTTTGLTTLNVSTTQTITGAYDIVHVLPTGHATLGADFTVNVSMDVQDGGSLETNCHAVIGTGTFTLAAGAHLYICDFAGIISSSSNQNGAIQVTGTRTFSDDASYTYNLSNSGQNTGDGLPSTVRDLEVNGTGNLLTTTNSVSIRRTLKITNGDIDPNGQTLTLLSGPGPDGTALIDNTGGTVMGPIHAQRYVNNTLNPGLGYRHFGLPVLGSGTQFGSGGSPMIANSAYNSATPAAKPAVTPYPTLFYYDETRVPANSSSVTDFNEGWQSPGGVAVIFSPGNAYTVQVSGGETLTFEGQPNNGPYALSGLTYGSGTQAGWHMLGNPYPAPLDWSTMTVGGAATNNLQNMNGAVYVYQSNGHYTGTYRSYQNGFGGSPLIASSQAFFVRGSLPGITGTVRFNNNNRVTTWSATNSTLYRATADTRPQIRLALTGSATVSPDETTVYFEAGATAGPDARYDAYKLPNVGPAVNIFSVIGPETLSINGLAPLASTALTVPLGLSVPQAGTYTLRAADLLHFGNTAVYLRDALANTTVNLSQQPSYAFTVAANALSSNTRFSLLFRPGTVTATLANLDATQVALFPNPARREFTLLAPALPATATVAAQLCNALGQVVLTRSLPMTGTGVEAQFDVRDLPAGVYSLRLQVGRLAPLTKRLVIE